MNSSKESLAFSDTIPMKQVETKNFSSEELLDDCLGRVEAVLRTFETERKDLVGRQAAITPAEGERLTEERKSTKYDILMRSNEVAKIQDKLITLEAHLELALRQLGYEYDAEKKDARESVGFALQAVSELAKTDFSTDGVRPIQVQYANMLQSLCETLHPLLKKAYDSIPGKPQN